MKISTALAIALFTSGSLMATDKTPQVVKDSFTKAYPKVAKVSWEEEDGNFEAKFKDGKKELSVIYKADGSLIETEELLKEAELPKKVTSEAHKAHPKAKFLEFAKITRADGTVVYEVEIKENGKETDLLFSPEGKETK